MKSALIGLLTFSVGVGSSSMAHLWLPIENVEPPAPLTLQALAIREQNVLGRAAEEFFDSFEGDDSFHGWFIADHFRGMDEVWTILLTKEIAEEQGTDEWTVLVLTKNPDGSSNDEDNFRSIIKRTKHGKNLGFRTNSIRGVSYEFDGIFLKTGHVFSQEERVLRGTMRKVVNGRLKAHFASDFAYAEPHCFH